LEKKRELRQADEASSDSSSPREEELIGLLTWDRFSFPVFLRKIIS